MNAINIQNNILRELLLRNSIHSPPMVYHNNFYKLCLYYDFMSFAPSCIDSFVKFNNDIVGAGA